MSLKDKLKRSQLYQQPSPSIRNGVNPRLTEAVSFSCSSLDMCSRHEKASKSLAVADLLDRLDKRSEEGIPVTASDKSQKR
jgi:hypothetical protein